MTFKKCFILSLFLMTFISCTEDEIIKDLASTDTFHPFTIPTVQTAAVSAVTASTATSGGIIYSEGVSGVSSRGVCWSTNPEPTSELPGKTVDGEGVGDRKSVV